MNPVVVGEQSEAPTWATAATTLALGSGHLNLMRCGHHASPEVGLRAKGKACPITSNRNTNWPFFAGGASISWPALHSKSWKACVAREHKLDVGPCTLMNSGTLTSWEGTGNGSPWVSFLEGPLTYTRSYHFFASEKPMWNFRLWMVRR